MKNIITKDYQEMSQLTARIIADEIKKKPNMAFAIPTGGTPIGTLQELVNIYNKEKLDFSKLKCFNIDEYVSLEKEHEQSYYYFLNHYLYQKTNISPSNTYVPNVFNDLEKECHDYEKIIQEHGNFDFILLGIGEDGHIGFNEPQALHQAYCHVQKLDQSTIEANSRFFEKKEEVPKHAITLGMATILKSKKIVLIANGKKKANVIKKLLSTQEINPLFPASFLLLHNDVTIICDQDAING